MGYPEAEQIPLWAFLLETISHIAADVQFHPVVYYFTGNYHDPDPRERIRAQGRHRLFEVYLDSWLRPRVKLPYGWYISDLLRANANNGDLLCAVLESILVPELIWQTETKHSESRWYDGMSQLAQYQALFYSTPVGAFMRGLSMIGGQKLKSIDSLLSFRRWEPNKFFDTALDFQNPVRGNKESATVETLISRAIADTLAFIGCFEPLIFGAPEQIESAFAGVVGKSLNYGVTNAPATAGKYFSEHGAPMPGLSK